MNLEQLIDLFLEEVCAGKTNETPKAYRSKLQHLRKFLNDKSSFSQGDIDNFKKYLLQRKTKVRGAKIVNEPLSIFSIRTILQTTRHFLKWACKQGYIPEIELMNVQEPEPDPKAIEQSTFERLIKTAAENGEPWERARNLAILYVLRDTGGRVGSIARMELEHIDWQRGYAIVPDKGGKPSWLYFNDQTMSAIREWLRWRDQADPQDYRLFIGERGRGLTRIGIYRAIEHLADLAGIKGRHNPHSFRHAFARDALLAGADLGQVSQLMNHRGIYVTDRYYARWKKSELKKFHRKFSPGRNLPTVKEIC